MAVRSASEGILADANADKRNELIELLKKAYWMEMETVMSYITNSINPDGVRAQEIIESLQADIQEELGHAQQFANRIKELYGVVPGSMDFTPEQSYLQPPEHQTDIVHVIKGVIEAETGAIEHYNRVIEFTDGVDYVTQDMVIAILRDEEGHRRLFEGYLREYEVRGARLTRAASWFMVGRLVPTSDPAAERRRAARLRRYTTMHGRTCPRRRPAPRRRRGRAGSTRRRGVAGGRRRPGPRHEGRDRPGDERPGRRARPAEPQLLPAPGDRPDVHPRRGARAGRRPVPRLDVPGRGSTTTCAPPATACARTPCARAWAPTAR